MIKILRFGQLGSCCALLALLSGCATGRKTAPKTYTFFPPSPDEPRVQLLTSFSSDAQLGRRGNFADFITGGSSAPAPLVKPYGLALKEGKLFVCDTMAASIQIFDLAKKRARYFVRDLAFLPRQARLAGPVAVELVAS